MLARQFTKGHTPFCASFRCHSVACADRPDANCGDRLLLPPSVLREAQRLKLPFPLLFQCSRGSKRCFCGVLEFSAPEDVAFVPKWIMEHLGLQEGWEVQLTTTGMAKPGTLARLKIPEVSFQKRVWELGAQKFLEKCMASYCFLEEGTSIMVDHDGYHYSLEVVSLEPEPVVSLLGHVDLEVEFCEMEHPSLPAAAPQPNAATATVAAEDAGADADADVDVDVKQGSTLPDARPVGMDMRHLLASPKKATHGQKPRRMRRRRSEGYGSVKKAFAAFSGTGNPLDADEADDYSLASSVYREDFGNGSSRRSQGRALGSSASANPAPWALRYSTAKSPCVENKKVPTASGPKDADTSRPPNRPSVEDQGLATTIAPEETELLNHPSRPESDSLVDSVKVEVDQIHRPLRLDGKPRPRKVATHGKGRRRAGAASTNREKSRKAMPNRQAQGGNGLDVQFGVQGTTIGQARWAAGTTASAQRSRLVESLQQQVRACRARSRTTALISLRK